jgi:hypothetical protein
LERTTRFVSIFARTASSLLAASLLAQMLGTTALARPHPGMRSIQLRAGAPAPAMRRMALPGRRSAVISRNGLVSVFDKNQRLEQARWVPSYATGDADALQSFLAHTPKTNQARPYAPHRLLVVFRDGVSASSDHVSVAAKTLTSMAKAKTSLQRQSVAPAYTNDSSVNGAFAALGVSNVDRLFAGVDRSRLSTMSVTARQATARPLLNVANAYRVQLTHGSVADGIAALRKTLSVAYVSPDWVVSTLEPPRRALPQAVKRRMREANVARLRESSHLRRAMSASSSNAATPGNFSVVSSLQSMLDSSGIDAMAAYAEITGAFHQLPGAGEIITNVSVGDTYANEDGSGPERPNDPCWINNQGAGPITHMIGGQRYLDYPGLPLIPTYAADSSGHIDPHFVSCGEGDPGEIDLDFSMMAPLPDENQRAGERASVDIGDLLGVAPGASYRLVVPATNAGGGGSFISAIAGVFLAAAMQTPKPDVITASLGFGYDNMGFPGRYLEDDPMMQSLVATIVNSMNVVVCISANDGMRTYTPTAIGPYGGSTPTNLAQDATQATNLSDLYFSTAPSADVDSGAIDVGGTTLNDIFSRPPGDPQYAQFASQFAYPETRYNGGQDYSSGFGSRVNISAPSDNVLALARPFYYASYDNVSAYSEGGTSAAAPEVAAGAAIAMQVARLTGHPFANARAVRDFLVQTGSPVMQPALTDMPLNVGPQLNVRRAVETLLANAGSNVTPGIARVAIAQRRPAWVFDSGFFTDTDPAYINLQGTDMDGTGPDGSGLNAWMTVAPDWTGIPDSSQYRLSIAGHDDRVLATTRVARLQPSAILSAAFPGQPIASATNRTVRMTYAALAGRRILAQTTFEVTFGPTDGTSALGFAPTVPAVVNGTSFQVAYDITHMRGMSNPMLVITEPGRFTPASGYVIHLPYVQPLNGASGTVTVPTSALQGGGIYGAAILSQDPVTFAQRVTDFAFFRLQDGGTQRPAPPLMRKAGDYGAASHILETGLGQSVTVTWDAHSVANATAAYLEVSAPGPTAAFLFNTFNNPNGSIPDNNGLDTGSVKVIPLAGLSGTATFTPAQLGLQNGMIQEVRVLATNGTAGAGESSDVGAIISDGQRNSFDGELDMLDNIFEGGFALDPQGRYGVMLPYLGGSGGYESSVDYFDLQTHADMRMQLAPVVGPAPLFTSGSIYANDSVLFGAPQANYSLQGAQFNLVSNLTQPYPGMQTLSFPSQNYAVVQMAQSPGASDIGMLTYDTSTPLGNGSVLKLMSMDTSSGIMYGPFDLATGPFDPFSNEMFFGADASLRKAMIVHGQANWNGFTPMYYDLVDMRTGATTTAQSIATGITSALAIDDTTHIAMTNSVGDNSLVLYDLQNGTQQKVQIPGADKLAANGMVGGLTGFTPEFIAADKVNHLFLVTVKYSPSVFDLDYNSSSAMYVFDEHGTYLKTVTGINSSSSPVVTWNLANYLQADGNARKAYLVTGSQLQVIDY